MLSSAGWQLRREAQAAEMVSGPSGKNLASPLVCSVTLVKSYSLAMLMMCSQTVLNYLLKLEMLDRHCHFCVCVLGASSPVSSLSFRVLLSWK